MSDKQKSSKAGRNAKSPQNSKYKNEKRRERNKLVRLQNHADRNGVTKEVRDRIRTLQITLGHSPGTMEVTRPKQRSSASAAFYRGPFATVRPNQMRQFGITPKGAA